MRLFMPLALGLSLALGAQPATAAAPKVWTQEWAVMTRPDVHVGVDDAHVRVHAGPTGRVSARVEYSFRRWGVMIGSAEPVVVFERKGDHLWITAHDPKGIGVIGGFEEQMTVDVTVPGDVQLSVRSGDGAIDCDPLSGLLTFETGDGAVRGHGLKGEIEVSTGDGRVILDDLEGKLRARSGDGRLGITGRFDALDLGTADGRIDATARKGSKVASGWNLQTGDGSVTLRIPHDLAALLDARTRDGHINVQLPISVAGRADTRILTGELNGGGLPLRVHTGDGSITLALSEL
jgi:hypothetical protein